MLDSVYSGRPGLVTYGLFTGMLNSGMKVTRTVSKQEAAWYIHVWKRSCERIQQQRGWAASGPSFCLYCLGSWVSSFWIILAWEQSRSSWVSVSWKQYFGLQPEAGHRPIWCSVSLCCFASSMTWFREKQGSKEGSTYWLFFFLKLEHCKMCKSPCYYQISLISDFVSECAGAVNH